MATVLSYILIVVIAIPILFGSGLALVALVPLKADTGQQVPQLMRRKHLRW
jgi:hypothetical protein